MEPTAVLTYNTLDAIRIYFVAGRLNFKVRREMWTRKGFFSKKTPLKFCVMTSIVCILTGETLFAKRTFEVPRVTLQCGLPITLLGVHVNQNDFKARATLRNVVF